MKIYLDAMGSDGGPEVEIEASKEALKEDKDLVIVLGGEEAAVSPLLRKFPSKLKDRLVVKYTATSVGHHEKPTKAIKKKDSSIHVGLELLKNNEVDAFVSAGNTGAVFADALLTVGRIKNIERPAIASIIPTKDKEVLLLDVGANVDAKPFHLVRFGWMGKIFMERVYERENPIVKLLNVGEEPEKGSKLIKLTYEEFEKERSNGLNFGGNIEGNEILSGKADVVVCDGFVGNILLKFGEGFAEMIFRLFYEVLKEDKRYKMRKWISKPVLKQLYQKLNYEEVGGAVLLGVNGTVVISHGRSSPKAIKNAIKMAVNNVSRGVCEKINSSFFG